MRLIPLKRCCITSVSYTHLDVYKRQAKYNGYPGDSAWTYPVGKISDEAQHLLDVTKESLFIGLEFAKANNRLSDISHAIQTYVESHNYSIVREYAGHGVGQDLHEDPSIPHYGPPGRGPRLKTGMTLAIEPMVNFGERYVRTLADNWTVVTRDKSICAHFEHTVVTVSYTHLLKTINLHVVLVSSDQ